MRTRVGLYIAKLAETGWLLALVAIPLFLNVYSHRVFEPDKLGLLRTIATLMFALGAILWLERSATRRDSLSWRETLGRVWRYPLVRPVLFVLLAYVLATLLSVAPRVSLWGSYQRLQGTYTLLSYIIVFVALLLLLRSREQLTRLTTAAILVSLPVALYGLIQHRGLDLLPWGGDVTQRVASTMGNAIFVAAYLIMIIPLTTARLMQSVRNAQKGLAPPLPAAVAGGMIVLWLVQTWAWLSLGFVAALWLCLASVVLLVGLGRVLRRPLAPFGLAGCYSLILAAQGVAILFSGSRGPQVGLVGGMLLFAVLYAAVRHRRRVLVGLVAIGLALVGLLVVLNLPDSPLAPVRDVPYIGRLGRVLELGEGTGRVRVLIWQGAVEMLSDNPLRAIVGYGPETMYVAYNPYYPPELAHLEARNATPDRSHNETFDALLTTGVLGLAASLALFVSVYYHGFSWLGLMPDRRSRLLFGLCATLGGLAGAVVPWALEGTLRLSGVGLPLGILIGVGAYAVLQALVSADRTPGLEGWPLLLMIALLAALAAHWIEISVGIAIAATRTYFWVYAALIVLLGQRAIATGTDEGTRALRATDSTPAPQSRRNRRATGRRRGAPHPRQGRQSKLYAPLIDGGLLLGVILCILFWNLSTNPQGEARVWGILSATLVTGAGQGSPGLLSAGVLWMFIAVFTVGVLVIGAELITENGALAQQAGWMRMFGVIAATAGCLTLFYGLLHMSRLIPPVDPESLLALFVGVVSLVALGWATALYMAADAAASAPFARGGISLVAVPLVIFALLLGNQLNLKPVRADIVYKQALRFDAESRWDIAAALYERAADFAPTQDHYWLFAGRARLEHARSMPDATQRDAAFAGVFDRLETARSLAPRNTDHTANLARAYRAWADTTTDLALRVERYELALGHFEEAVGLSPRNVQLYNEWGQIHAALGDYDGARAVYEQSLSLDDRFGRTYVLMGDLYSEHGEWARAIPYYDQGLELSPTMAYAWSRLAYAYAQLEDWDSAIDANLRIQEMLPNDYLTLRNLAYLYNYQGDYAQALYYMELAEALAPAGDLDVLRQARQELANKLAQEPEVQEP